MKYYSLPIDTKDLENIDPNDSSIDMSRLHFPVPPEKQVRSAFLFLRNTNIQLSSDFSKCTYNQKCEYLLEYFKGNISLKIPELIDAWMEILMIRSRQCASSYCIPREGEPIPVCHLFNDWQESGLFIYDNEHFVDEVLQLVISLPLCSIQYFLSDKENVKTDITMDEFPHSGWSELNLNNFIHLLDNEVIITLTKPVGQLRPTFYTKYFSTEGNPYISKMIAGLPFLRLLNVMMYNSGDKSFADTLGEMLDKEVGGNND